jgi:tRNA threonylcarbamoyladenosine biosynthesis protein TsaE
MEFHSPEALMEHAAEIAAELGPGDVIALVGDLGAGKTHFSKGLVRGLGCAEPVSSPTFSLVQEYKGGRLPVFHFDLYRLKHGQELLELGWDDYLEGGGVCLVEWADLFPQFFPQETLWLKLTVTGGHSRSLERMEVPYGD